MTGASSHQGAVMSDDNDSGGIIGTIISIFILAAIWPYLLALLGIYIAYMVAVAILDWISQNWILVSVSVLCLLSLYCILRYRLIQKCWKILFQRMNENCIDGVSVTKIDLSDKNYIEGRKFNPSTNLYCYWCTKKLGIKAYEASGKYYCQECFERLKG